MSHVVVVGASVAGVKLVQNLRSEGFTGAITLVDQESHPLYDRPPLSKKYLSGAASDPEIALTTAEALEGLRVIQHFRRHLDAGGGGARLGHRFQGFAFMRGITLDRIDQVRHQIGAALVLVQHFGPAGLDGFVLLLDLVVAAAR